MFNHIVLTGRLTRDPELRVTTQSGTNVATFSIAVDRSFKAQNGQKETDFIDCVAWRTQAEFVAENLKKGQLIGVEGRLQIRSYETQDGQKRRAAEVVVERVHYLEPKNKSGAAPATEELPDDIPF